jgi:serine protease Do
MSREKSSAKPLKTITSCFLSQIAGLSFNSDFSRPQRAIMKESEMSANMRNGFVRTFVPLVLALITPAGVAQSRPTGREASVQSAADLSATLEETSLAVGLSVVEIFTTSYKPAGGMVPRSADLLTAERASGSGVIVDPDGYIVTNAHVVQGAQSLRVEISRPRAGRSILATSSRTVAGRIIGIDEETDLAVIRIDEHNLPALSFGDSDELKAGQLVLAFGSPLGLRNSVSLGVVSGVARQIDPDSPMIYIQTDASINPGSSGGPLVDLRGRVVGINTLIESRSGGNEGVGLSAPSNIVRTVYEQIKKNGRVRRGEIGIRAQTITAILASGLGLSRDQGVILADVKPDSPADQAGLRPGDLVLSLDGKPMENARQLQINLYRHSLGDVVSLQILRDRQTLTVPAVINERKNDLSGLSATIDPRDNLVQKLGILGINLNQRLVETIPVVRVRFGVVVASTVAGAIDAREGGLAVGDVISTVNKTAIRELSDLRTALDGLKTGDPVVLQLERRGELMYLAFTIE